MDWKEWEPLYIEIVSELGLDPEADMQAAMLLRHLASHLSDPSPDLERLIGGRRVVICGPSDDERGLPAGDVSVSAGSAAETLMRRGIVPDIIVTDLDGGVMAQVEAARLGAIPVIHAHGDNMDALREAVPRFTGAALCTTQNRPFPGVRNFGGFTDGDRAVFLALHFGASSISFRGFDLSAPAAKPGTDPARKAAKLVIAARLLERARSSAGAGVGWEW